MTHSDRPRVIVGVAGTVAGLRALRVAVTTAQRQGAVLHAVRAFPAAVFLESAEARERTAWDEIAQAFADALGGPPRDLDLAMVAIAGRPGPSLVSYAHRDTDLLIIGVDRRPRWRRLFPGTASVPRYCLAHAFCPLQVVPPDEFARDVLRHGGRRRISHHLSTLTRS